MSILKPAFKIEQETFDLEMVIKERVTVKLSKVIKSPSFRRWGRILERNMADECKEWLDEAAPRIPIGILNDIVFETMERMEKHEKHRCDKNGRVDYADEDDPLATHRDTLSSASHLPSTSHVDLGNDKKRKCDLGCWVTLRDVAKYGDVFERNSFDQAVKKLREKNAAESKRKRISLLKGLHRIHEIMPQPAPFFVLTTEELGKSGSLNTNVIQEPEYIVIDE